ncbi:hypothetical protein [Streptomyces sp. NPDC004658]|uniref:hypothetical protein n=1 Tax=Streptomyces sp. NPDC004658 TaxID=3154672 RepID=UPI0033BD5A90
MTLRSKLLPAVAALTAAGGLATAGTVAADAATAGCGDRCIQVYSARYGTATHPRLVETVHRGVAEAGRPTVMRPVSTTDPAGDIVGHRAGLVSDFHKDGLLSAEVNRHYGTLRAVEVEYAPHGEPTGLCAGLAVTAYQDEGLTLQKCGTSSRTVWIIDTADSPATASQGHFPLVNGSTTDFAHPYAMTFTHASPRHGGSGERDHRACVPGQIRVARLMGNPSHVPAGQLWGTTKQAAE